ncbi:MAG: LysR family transcriptional regulator [Cyanobacteria bacterium P01_D01_bin.73]
MRIEQLQAFLAVAETGSFQKAARLCRVTQSTISRQVQSLENHLGLSLLRRHDRAKLTPGGEVLLTRARRICQDWQQAVEDIGVLLEGRQPELCVAAIQSVCAYQLPAILPKFLHDYPKVQLRVTALGSDRSLKVLRDGLVDAAIVMNNRFLTANADTVVDLLYREPVFVLVGAQHPLAEKESVDWADLADYPQVVFKDGYGMQRLVQEQASLKGVEVPVSLELNTLDAFRGVVREGNFLALLPESALVEVREDERFAVLELAGANLEREVVFVTSADRLELPPIRRFRELVLEHLGQSPPLAKLGEDAEEGSLSPGGGGGHLQASMPSSWQRSPLPSA